MVTCCVYCVSALGDDWPQWLGPQRDSIWREKGIVETFPQQGLTIRWRAPVAGGYAGPAVVGNRVYVTDYVRASGDAQNDSSRRTRSEGRERALCLDAADGTLVWKHEYDCPYHVSYPAGPRVTPTVAGGKVYTLGAMGNLGRKVVWSHPAFANRSLYARNDKELVCVSLAVE
ncbi:MAG: hypothetical protein A2V70_20530 [Planctomycetes bacterium RBG_13_63_9]|nr:MAG: hypothetical protein A2V70_20530 [Planctomycetes bacterium RBG_13_63_9]